MIKYNTNEILDINSFEYIATNFESDFTIELREDVILNYTDNILTITMDESGYGRNIRKAKIDDIKNIRILSDTSALEIYINDGLYLISTRAYSNKNNFKSTLDGTFYKLNKVNWQ